MGFYMKTPPEKLDLQILDGQGWLRFQFLPSLLRRGGWFANALHLTQLGHRGCNPPSLLVTP